MDTRDLTFSHLLWMTAHHWRLAMDRRLKGLGMSQASWVAVAAIARNATPLSQGELAQQLGVESATLVPLLNRLVEQHLVERVTPPGDRRKRLLVATDQGQALFEKVKVEADSLRETILSTIPPEELAVTRRVLDRLLQEIEKQ
ncbi:MarR family transcriptional regulator [Cronobacter turicensis]|uniref:MarR family winged helix-turn-helix transcriptional regulator n=1 Tax=Cronobacter TaxID=413496 RepID=UPI0013EE1F98|nr:MULTISPECIES: MarR family transcriptional regulator [Cronobacter]EGT4491860.1 MarR family transcriptional regulator [Cronobacter turicensis]EGT4494723.1 MarR family transcriptional regulator [Cronobacter turicensis]EKM0436331.1 MarR family transcriptional regulator [Cronobacter turicensis]ELQ6226393.1 MarR family transcriptional regulator [Cronobacter turicensis]ELY3544606.1 MarR family transcriptional regulator [Cronobacter turicensis]